MTALEGEEDLEGKGEDEGEGTRLRLLKTLTCL
jgi:hypothetical protein